MPSDRVNPLLISRFIATAAGLVAAGSPRSPSSPLSTALATNTHTEETPGTPHPVHHWNGGVAPWPTQGEHHVAAGGTGGPVVHNVPFVSFPSDPEQTNIKQQHSLSTYDELLHALLSSLHHKDQKRQAPNPPSGQPGSNVPSSNSSNGNKGQFDDGFGSCSKEGELFFKGSPLPWCRTDGADCSPKHCGGAVAMLTVVGFTGVVAGPIALHLGYVWLHTRRGLNVSRRNRALAYILVGVPVGAGLATSAAVVWGLCAVFREAQTLVVRRIHPSAEEGTELNQMQPGQPPEALNGHQQQQEVARQVTNLVEQGTHAPQPERPQAAVSAGPRARHDLV